MERLRADLVTLGRDDQLSLVRSVREDRLIAKRRPDAAGARSKRRDNIIRWFWLLTPEWRQHVLDKVRDHHPVMTG